jgi:BMFP domain-containing protein YqiC
MAEHFIEKEFKSKEEKLAELDAVSYEQFHELEKLVNTLEAEVQILTAKVEKLEVGEKDE